MLALISYFSVWPSCAGPIPKELGALSELQGLDLQNNELSGKESAKTISSFSYSIEWRMDAYAYASMRTRPWIYGDRTKNNEDQSSLLVCLQGLSRRSWAI